MEEKQQYNEYDQQIVLGIERIKKKVEKGRTWERNIEGMWVKEFKRVRVERVYN